MRSECDRLWQTSDEEAATALLQAAQDVVNGSAQYVVPSPPSLGKRLCFRHVQRCIAPGGGGLKRPEAEAALRSRIVT